MKITTQNGEIFIDPETAFPRWSSIYASLLMLYVNPHCPKWFAQVFDSEVFAEVTVQHVQAEAFKAIFTRKPVRLSDSTPLNAASDKIFSLPARFIDSIRSFIDSARSDIQHPNHL